MKKILKVFLAVMTVVTMLSQVAAFADCTYTTDTSYDLSTGKAKVTSTVYGIGDGEEVTFLVERLNTDTNSDEILYIDQINTSEYDDATNSTATGESASFSYLIPVAKADGTAKVRFASTANSASTVLPEDGGVSAETPGTDDTVVLDKYTVTYSVVGNGAVTVAEETEDIAYGDTALTTDAYAAQELTFYFAPDPGWEVVSYQKGDVTVDIPGLFSTVIPVDGDMNVVFTFAETAKSETAEAPSFKADEQSVEYNQTAAAVKDRYVTMFSSLVVDNNIVEYGILVSKDAIVTDDLDISSLSPTTDPVKKFQALGAYNGRYAVKLVNGTSDYLDGTLNVVSYAVAEDASGNQAVSFGEAASVTYDAIAE